MNTSNDQLDCVNFGIAIPISSEVSSFHAYKLLVNKCEIIRSCWPLIYFNSSIHSFSLSFSLSLRPLSFDLGSGQTFDTIIWYTNAIISLTRLFEQFAPEFFTLYFTQWVIFMVLWCSEIVGKILNERVDKFGAESFNTKMKVEKMREYNV